MNFVALYLLIINIITFVMMKADKDFAEKQMQRIKEFTFFIMSTIGGGLGIILGMGTFCHKTKKPMFTYVIPRVTAVEAVIFALLFILIGV